MKESQYQALRATPEALELREAAVKWIEGDQSPVDPAPDRRLLEAALALAARIERTRK